MDTALSQRELDALFPPDTANAFFEALYGEAEEGAYDIKLVFRKGDAETLQLAFELHQRPGKCLVCNLTYGLPQVFQRHPIINVQGLSQRIAVAVGWTGAVQCALGRTEEHSAVLHCVPLTITHA